MSDMDLFRAMVRAIGEDERRERSASRATWWLVALGSVTASAAVATFIVVLLTYLAR